MSLQDRGATIRLPHDTICIVIQTQLRNDNLKMGELFCTSILEL